MYSGLWQTSKIEAFAKAIIFFYSSTVFANISILDVCQGSLISLQSLKIFMKYFSWTGEEFNQGNSLNTAYRYFFSSFGFLHGHLQFTKHQGKEENHSYFSLSVLSVLSVQEHSDFFLHCMHLSDYLIYLITTHVNTRLLIGKIYPPLAISIWINVNCILHVDFMPSFAVKSNDWFL